MNAEGKGNGNTVGVSGKDCAKEKEDKAATTPAEDDKRQGEGDAIAQEEERAVEYISIKVKTKTEDGGSRLSPIRRNGRRDAFLHYSNDAVRRRHLLGLEDEDQGEDMDADKDSARKTRLSFELHPSNFYDDLFQPLQDMNMQE